MEKNVNNTQILNDDQVREYAKELKAVLTDRAHVHLVEGLIDIEEVIRMMSISNKFKEARGLIGKNIKEIAGEIRVPQYRLKAVESGTVREIQTAVLLKYCDYLDLGEWFRKWIISNKALALKLGIQKMLED